MKYSLLSTMILAGILAAGSTLPAGAEELFPPNAKAGECYTRVFVPATYKTVTEKVLSRDAATRLEIVPATYKWAEEKVLVSEASAKFEVVPATYGWADEVVTIKPATKQLVEVPAVYENKTEKVMVKPATTAWKKGRGPVEKVDNSTGEIMCLVETPAEYKNVSKRVLKTAARTEEKTIPAQTKTVKKKVVAKPATTRKVEIPAKYETVKVRKLATPATTKSIEIPAKYTTVTRREAISESKMAWAPILCETNTTRDVVRKLQAALDKAGFSPGPIDGMIGSATMSAVARYQSAKGLPKGGLTIKTLQSLGVL